MSDNSELESIDRQIASENDRHRRRIEQLRQQKQRIKDKRAREKEQKQLRTTYKECMQALAEILIR